MDDINTFVERSKEVTSRVNYSFFKVILFSFFSFLKILFIYFRERKGGRKRERNINVQLPLMCPLLGTWPATQACALTGNQTSDRLVCRPVLNPLSHTSEGNYYCFNFPLFCFPDYVYFWQAIISLSIKFLIYRLEIKTR